MLFISTLEVHEFTKQTHTIIQAKTEGGGGRGSSRPVKEPWRPRLQWSREGSPIKSSNTLLTGFGIKTNDYK